MFVKGCVASIYKKYLKLGKGMFAKGCIVLINKESFVKYNFLADDSEFNESVLCLLDDKNK